MNPPSRRELLVSSAAVAAGAGLLQAQDAKPAAASGAPTNGPDGYALAERFGKFLRVTDVTDGLDALGRADKCLLDRSIRPLWMGARFWGPAVTMRVIPSHRMMPVISRNDALRQHAIWKEMGGWHAELK